MAAQNKVNAPLYPTSSASPFEDRYDIEGEREALKDLLAAENPDETDLRWPRLVELKQREERCARCGRSMKCAREPTAW